MTQRRIMRTREVAEYLRISMTTVYRWTTHYGMPVSKPGGLNEYEMSEIDAWWDQHKARTILERHQINAGGRRGCFR